MARPKTTTKPSRQRIQAPITAPVITGNGPAAGKSAAVTVPTYREVATLSPEEHIKEHLFACYGLTPDAWDDREIARLAADWATSGQSLKQFIDEWNERTTQYVFIPDYYAAYEQQQAIYNQRRLQLAAVDTMNKPRKQRKPSKAKPAAPPSLTKLPSCLTEEPEIDNPWPDDPAFASFVIAVDASILFRTGTPLHRSDSTWKLLYHANRFHSVKEAIYLYAELLTAKSGKAYRDRVANLQKQYEYVVQGNQIVRWAEERFIFPAGELGNSCRNGMRNPWYLENYLNNPSMYKGDIAAYVNQWSKHLTPNPNFKGDK